MIKTDVLVQKVEKGIQERKGKRIAVINMTQLENIACSYFVVCEGDSTTHVNAVADSVIDYVWEHASDKPLNKDGFKNSEWIAVDYGDIMVHVFQKEPRDYYKLEALWADAEIDWIEDIY